MVGRSATLDRVTSYWMPELQRLGVQVPVILVACKSDLRVGDHHLQQAGPPLPKPHTHTHTHTHTYTHTLCVSLSRSLPRAHTHTHAHAALERGKIVSQWGGQEDALDFPAWRQLR